MIHTSKFRIKADTSNHGIPLGTEITKMPQFKTYVREDTKLTFYWNFFEHELQSLPLTKGVIFERLDAVKEEMSYLHKQLEWMEATGNFEFDESKFKVYQVLKIARDAIKLRGTEEEQNRALNDATTQISKLIG